MAGDGEVRQRVRNCAETWDQGEAGTSDLLRERQGFTFFLCDFSPPAPEKDRDLHLSSVILILQLQTGK